MIIEVILDPIEEGGSYFVKHYSDDPAKALLQEDTGLLYKEAIDLIDTEHTYIEVDDPDFNREEE